jgi:hypothetical protein
MTMEEQVDMARKDFEVANAELLQLIELIKQQEGKRDLYSLSEDLFDKTMKAWKDYSEQHGQFSADAVESGTLAPVFYYTTLWRLTREKIESLKNEFSIALRHAEKRKW